MLQENATADRQPRAVRLHWYIEAAAILAFYVVYSWVRNQYGSATVAPALALHNAQRVVDIERSLGLFVEPHVQHAFLGWSWFVRMWNIYYGTLHFIVTAGVLVFLFRRRPDRYRVMRTTLGFTTALALIGFTLFPLMPPRLLNDVGTWGGGDLSFDFVDTLSRYGGLWSFDSGGMAAVSNQYAAMPSLHIGWSLWCALAIWPVVRNPWVRGLFACYPLVTLFAIVVTANHFWLDAVGGVAVLCVGYALARRCDPLLARVRNQRGQGRRSADDEDTVGATTSARTG